MHWRTSGWAAVFIALAVVFSAAFLGLLMTLALTCDLRMAALEAGTALGCGTLALRLARGKL